MSTKKPSSPVNIGGEKYYKYLIVWNDIVGDSTITDLNDFENMKTAIIKTEAYILYVLNSFVNKYIALYTLLHIIYLIR